MTNFQIVSGISHIQSKNRVISTASFFVVFFVACLIVCSTGTSFAATESTSVSWAAPEKLEPEFAQYRDIYKATLAAFEKNFEVINGQTYLTAGRHQFRSIWTRDFCHSVRGLLAIGQYELVKRELDLLIDHRRKSDGLVPRSLDSNTRGSSLLGLEPTQWRVFRQISKHLVSLFQGEEAESEPLGNLVAEYVSENGTEAIDSNLLVLLAALDYAEVSGDNSWLQSQESALKQIYSYYGTRKQGDLIVQPAFSDWQDSAKREGYTFLTNLLHWHLLDRWLKYPEYGIGHKRVAEYRDQIQEMFFDQTRGLYRSVFGFEQVSLDGNLSALDFNFLEPATAQVLYKNLASSPLWRGEGSGPGFATYPNYPENQISDTAKIAGLRHYHDRYYWSWLMGYSLKIAQKMGDRPNVAAIAETLRKLVLRDEAIAELYFPEQGLPIWSSDLLAAEKPFSWGSSYILEALKSRFGDSLKSRTEKKLDPRRYSVSLALLQKDLRYILKEGGLKEDLIAIRVPTKVLSDPNRSSGEATSGAASGASAGNLVSIECSSGRFTISVAAAPEEVSSAFYFGLQKMGFLFPHPRLQVTPELRQMNATCGRSFTWKPRFVYRGFHLHTMHPSEWLYGFLMGEKKVAQNTLLWLMRNGQNVAQVVLLNRPLAEIKENLAPLIRLAHRYGITFGVDTSFALQQQKAYRLIGHESRGQLVLGSSQELETELRGSLARLTENLAFDFMTIELGSSEFTPIGYQQTVDWLRIANEELTESGRVVFTKIHTSVNQIDPKWGNFNFLPQYLPASLGVLPHTVMFYGLQDTKAPVYGRQDFGDMRDFMLEQSKVRPTWYYPETSYYVAMDIDVPLFLTDYLVARSEDMDFSAKNDINGHITFSTGQELGYWLMDWTVALLNNREYRGDPLIGLKLLGESEEVWTPILDFQTKYFKNADLIEELSSENMMDEVPYFENHVLHRVPLKDLESRPEYLKERLASLEAAALDKPNIDGIRNRELRIAVEMTFLRLDQALQLRRAIVARVNGEGSDVALKSSENIRMRGMVLGEELARDFNRYPEANLFEERENISSYPYGYGWTARTLHFWKREEFMIRDNNFSPFFMNIYDPERLLL